MNDQTKPETPARRPLGDTGDGDPGVPAAEQGISNRPGDRAEGEEGADSDPDVEDPSPS